MVDKNDKVVIFRGQGYDGVECQRLADITMIVDGNPAVKDMPGRIEFRTVPSGFDADIETRMVIKSTGNIGIGDTGPDNILTVMQNSATDPIADAWTTYSSGRWKTNIKTIPGALDKVQLLRGVSFDWKTSGKHDIGLIAEEVAEVIPEVVAYEENGQDAQSIDYSRLVAVLIEALKEQQDEIDQLKIKVSELESIK